MMALPKPASMGENEHSPMSASHVSVVIATYRRPGMLRDAVRSLWEAAAPEGVSVEIIVIDNDPDGTVR